MYVRVARSIPCLGRPGQPDPVDLKDYHQLVARDQREPRPRSVRPEQRVPEEEQVRPEIRAARDPRDTPVRWQQDQQELRVRLYLWAPQVRLDTRDQRV